MLDLCLLGTGGMMPLPYRWLTSLMTRFNGSTLMIDCGEGTQIAVREKGWSCNPIDVICFTHYHGDHISGLPGLLLTMGNADRTEPLTLIGPKGLERVECAAVIAPELPFPIIFKRGRKRAGFRGEGLSHSCLRVQHNLPRLHDSDSACRPFMLKGKRAWHSAYLSGVICKRGEETMTDGDKVYTPDMVMGEKEGIRLRMSQIQDRFQLLLSRQADADFICEGMYGRAR